MTDEVKDEAVEEQSHEIVQPEAPVAPDPEPVVDERPQPTVTASVSQDVDPEGKKVVRPYQAPADDGMIYRFRGKIYKQKKQFEAAKNSVGRK